ncbi:hypothetical protein FACS1894160_4290 [Bacteroidia bacterium]|nr:hypothetical protein FACS1894160_4290 [Bacteroidia bacterium]
MIFQTIIMNSGFSTTVVNDNLRYIDWVTGPEYPRIFAFDNFDELICSNKIFARKFDIHKDSAIIGKIEAYIFNKQIKLLL